MNFSLKKAIEITIVIAGIIGFIFVIGSIGTSDYYVMELGCEEPPFIWRNILIGILLMTPGMVRMVRGYVKEGVDNDPDR